jgi:hypothetical protein
MKKQNKVLGLITLATAAAVSTASATPDFSTLQTDITGAVSTYETVAIGVLGISVGVAIVGMVIKWMRKAAK